jgi:hypothetical protein
MVGGAFASTLLTLIPSESVTGFDVASGEIPESPGPEKVSLCPVV